MLHSFVSLFFCVFFFFFKQKTAYEMRISDWSSDVCSSDLLQTPAHARRQPTSLPMSAIALAPSLTLSCWWPSAASLMHARRWRIRRKSSVPRVSTYSRRWAAVGEQTRVDDYLHAFDRHQPGV